MKRKKNQRLRPFALTKVHLNEVAHHFDVTTTPLRQDLQTDSERLMLAVTSHTGESAQTDNFDLHLKSAIRSLFGFAEATYNILTPIVLRVSESGSFPLHPADRAILMELEYDPELETCLQTFRPYPLGRRLRVSLNLFNEVCGAPPLPDWPPAIKLHFRDLSKVRNKFTHPTRLEDFPAIPGFESFRQIVTWLPAQIFRSVIAATAPHHLSQLPAYPELSPHPVDFSRLKPEVVFDEDFYQQVLSRPSVAIRYINMMFERLHVEIRWTFDRNKEALTDPYCPNEVGHATRQMVRALTTYAEGILGLAQFFLRALRIPGKSIAIQSIRGESVPNRLCRTLTAFSHAFGEDHEVTKLKPWSHFCSIFKIRDRLTHPNGIRDVALGLGHLETSMQALDWIIHQAEPALTLNQEKIAMCLGVRRSVRTKNSAAR